MSKTEDLLTKNTNCFLLSAAAQVWLSLRTDLLAGIVIFATSILACLARDTLSPGLAGLMITYAFEVMEALSWMVMMACNLETNSVSLERIMEYFGLEQEANDEYAEEPPEDWPDVGMIQFKDYSTRYREELDFSLKKLNFGVEGSEKIGICGRTGAGKSSVSKVPKKNSRIQFKFNYNLQLF